MPTSTNVVLRPTDPLIVAFSSATCNQNEIGPTFDRLASGILAYIGTVGVSVNGPAFIRFRAWRASDTDIDCGFVVDQTATSGPGVNFGTLGGETLNAAVDYVGPESGVSAVHDVIEQWIGEKGYELEGSPYELYYDDPAEVPQNQLRTTVVWPIEIKG